MPLSCAVCLEPGLSSCLSHNPCIPALCSPCTPWAKGPIKSDLEEGISKLSSKEVRLLNSEIQLLADPSLFNASSKLGTDSAISKGCIQ